MSKRNKRLKHNNKRSPRAKPRRQPRQTVPQRSIEQALGLAVQHHTAGNLPKAEGMYQQILKSNPNQPHALNLLGVLAHQVGKNDMAVELISKAIAVKPDFAEAHSSLGITLKGLGRLEEAAASYRKALAIKPNYADAHNNLGNVLQELGQVEDAVSSFHKALANKPDYVTANNLGNALRALGRFEEAVVSYDKALAIRPDYAQAHRNRGNALKELDRLEEAVASYREAIALEPDYVEAHNHLGRVLSELGQLDEAIASQHQAIAIDPNNIEALFCLACIYERTSQLDKADVHVQRVLEIDPDRRDIAIIRAVLLRRRGNNREAVEILEALPLDELRSDQASRAHFELGKLYDLALDSERAFRCFTKGNQVQIERKGGRADAVKYRKIIEHTTRRLTPELVESWRTETDASAIDCPVFLVGFPRSGTTLLDQILDGHPRLQVMEEKPAIADLLSIVHNTLGGYPSALASLPDAEIRNLREQYYRNVEQHFCRNPDAILVDKYPLNIVYIPTIARLFPTARIILALRHPADVVLSNFMQLYNLNDAMANFNTIEDAARLYHRVMTLWLQCTRLLPLNIYTVKYEDVVADLESEARSLFQFLELDWNEAVLDYRHHARQRGRISTPSYEQVTEPIYQRAKYRWKRYEEQLKPVLPELQPFIEAFGYA